MRFFVLFLLGALLVSSCREASTPPEKSDRIIRSDSGDPILDEIALEARETISDFIRHLRNPHKGEERFRIKYPFRADSGSGIDKEYLWLSDITFMNGSYFANVANRPYYTSGIELGSEVTFFMDDIADWMYIRNGKIVGGRSIKYLIDKIPPLDRDEEMERLLGLFE